MELGIGTYTYGWSTGVYHNEASEAALREGFAFLGASELIDRAVHLDAPVVQICVRPDLAAMDEAELHAIRGYADDRDVTLEVGTIGSDVEHLQRFLQIAQSLGARLVRTIFTDASPGLSEERLSVAAIADEYAAAQVTLAIENYEMASFLELQAFCHKFDNEYVGVCLDTVNSLGRGEGVREVTEALMPYTKCLHVKDFKVVRHESNMAFAVVGTPAGAGLLDIPAQLRMLQDVQPDASIVLEQWTPYQGTFQESVRVEGEWAEIGMQYLQEQLTRIELEA